MKKTKGLFWGALVIVILCWTGGAGAAEILIGISAPFSGPAAEYGQDCANGVDLAIREINAAGGVTIGGQKYTFKLEKLDDRIDPTQAVNNARRFRAKGAVAVFNTVFNTSAAMMKINQEKGNEFLVMAFTSTPRVEKLGNKLTLVAPGPFTAAVDIYSRWAAAKGYKKCAMVVTLGAYGDEWRRGFRTAWEKQGGVITADKPANYYKDTDFSSHLTAALAGKPDFLLIGGPSAPTSLVVEQARSLGFKGGFVLIDQARQDHVADLLKGTKLLGDTIGPAAGKHMPPRPGQNFITNYRETFKKAGSTESSVTFTMMHSLARAVAAAGSLDVYKIRAAFPRAFPILADKSPMEVHGLSEEGRFLIQTSTQKITKGEFEPPIVYAWWPKSQEEFDRYKQTTKLDKSIIQQWLKTK